MLKKTVVSKLFLKIYQPLSETNIKGTVWRDVWVVKIERYGNNQQGKIKVISKNCFISVNRKKSFLSN